MKALKYAFTWLGYKLKPSKHRFKFPSQVHYTNRICDVTTEWPNCANMWASIHGFDEGHGQTYWIGFDIRSFGIRVGDYVIKCKNKSTYDEYINCAIDDPEKLLHKMHEDTRMNCRCGNEVGVKFVFKWIAPASIACPAYDGEKTFNVHLDVDSYAEERVIGINSIPSYFGL